MCLLCPEDREGETNWDRLLGGETSPKFEDIGWACYIPLENGALIDIQWSCGRNAAVVTAVSGFCIKHSFGPEDACWLPEHLIPAGDKLVIGFAQHDAAYEDWIVEWIERISTKQVVSRHLVDGQMPRMISLKEGWTLHYEQRRKVKR